MEQTVRGKGSQLKSAAVALTPDAGGQLGKRKKRVPPTARLLPDGRYEIVDGNATHEAAENSGWERFPVRVLEGEALQVRERPQSGGMPKASRASGESPGTLASSSAVNSPSGATTQAPSVQTSKRYSSEPGGSTRRTTSPLMREAFISTLGRLSDIRTSTNNLQWTARLRKEDTPEDRRAKGEHLRETAVHERPQFQAGLEELAPAGAVVKTRAKSQKSLEKKIDLKNRVAASVGD